MKELNNVEQVNKVTKFISLSDMVCIPWYLDIPRQKIITSVNYAIINPVDVRV